jgi:hypothetical protein
MSSIFVLLMAIGVIVVVALVFGGTSALLL